MNPLFSIVIANYNHGIFLERAILSILNQNCTDYEIILVDGGSTDNSLDIIKNYSHYFFWWVSEKDKGQSNAFNKGFSHSRGRFFLWLNADDILLPNTLFKAKHYLTKHSSCVWLTGNTITIDVNDRIRECKRGPVWIKFLVQHGHVYVYGPTTIFHHKLLKEVGGFNENLHYTMDYDLWFKFINKGYKFHRINHYCWAFRIHNLSKTSHSFFGKVSIEYSNEREQVLKDNNRIIYKYVRYFHILLKMISGCYILSLIDTEKYKNKSIHIFRK